MGPAPSLSQSLLALVLVAKSSRGQSIVFSYPSAPKSIPRSTKPVYPSARASSASSSSDSEDEEEESGLADTEGETYLGFPSAVLGALLCPNRELCDQPFEVILDHLAFVGHPVWLGDDEDPLPNPVAEDRGRRHRADQGELTTQDQVAVGSHTSSFHSHTTSIHGQGRLTSFNLVVVIDTPPDSHLSRHLEGWYRDVVLPVTATLKYLERSSKWLGKEAAKLRRAQERYEESSKAAPAPSLAAVSPLASSLTQLFRQLKVDQRCSFSLGNVPVQVLLRGDQSSDVESESDAEEPETFPNGGEGRPASPVGERTHGRRAAPLFSRVGRRSKVRFEPWQTLLPLEEPDTLKQDVGRETLLWKFLDIWAPTLSFAELETLLDIELGERTLMQEMVDHLVHWRKGRVVDVVSLKNIYALRGGWEPSSLSDLIPRYTNAFPSLPPLPVLLAQISKAASTNTAISTVCPRPPLRPLYLSAFIWLLVNSVIEKQRTFIRVLASPELKKSARMKWGLAASGTTLEGSEMTIGSTEGVLSEGGSELERGSEGSGLGRERRRKSSTSNGLDLKDTRGMAIVSTSPTIITPVEAPSSPLARSLPPNPLLMKLPKNRRGSNLAPLPTTSLHTSSPLAARSKPSPMLTPGALLSRTYSSTSNSEQRPSFDASFGTASIVLDPGRPSQLEGRWLAEMSRDKDSRVVESFERMVRLLDGAHSVDEIRHRTNLSRRELREVLSVYGGHLVLFYHP